MKDLNGNSHYPLDNWLGIEKHQRYSPLVEVQVAELVSDATYRDTAKFIEAWTPVEISHHKSTLEEPNAIKKQKILKRIL